MPESQTAYLGFDCPKCGKAVGEFITVKIDGHFGPKIRTRLRIGGLIVNYAIGNCSYCGAPVEFRETTKTLDRLIERSRRLKNML